MSDYQDLCEMYERSASDPDFIDDLIDEISQKERTYEEEFEWYQENEAKKHFEILSEQVQSVGKILEVEIPKQAKFSLLVMLYAHIVSAIEGYLAGVFIHHVCNSESLTRKLVETDPELGKRKFSLSEIYQQSNTLSVTVSSYLKNLIFHDLKKIKPMYETVLGHTFSDMEWLFQAVQIRHHCVHRAGYDKDGNTVNITVESIFDLLGNVEALANEVDDTLDNLAP
ncbi:MAG: hypothetical protein GYB28_15640 [Gammaproteobacteria bacterium]|uniref:hypothetical protein n=1 Tax=Vreelandella venusta TaxID=44935 RepID=UPI00295E911A|nr:hypothetical protein [Halomonas venusta]MBR9926407.1 hypothetical protein [Gammaproteobacteria bacterium]MDW0360539.1 hypothetical protein [Halomonas venusta]